MGNFKSNNGNRFNDRFNKRFRRKNSERGAREMYDVTCTKCGKKCQVPFKPTGSKPVYCKDCFSHNEGSKAQGQPSSGSSEQFRQINAKLDKILAVLQDLEIEVDEDYEDEDSDEDFEEDSGENLDESSEDNSFKEDFEDRRLETAPEYASEEDADEDYEGDNSEEDLDENLEDVESKENYSKTDSDSYII